MPTFDAAYAHIKWHSVSEDQPTFTVNPVPLIANGVPMLDPQLQHLVTAAGGPQGLAYPPMNFQMHPGYYAIPPPNMQQMPVGGPMYAPPLDPRLYQPVMAPNMEDPAMRTEEVSDGSATSMRSPT